MCEFESRPLRHGEMSEWLKEPALKSGEGYYLRGFESHSLRQLSKVAVKPRDQYTICRELIQYPILSACNSVVTCRLPAPLPLADTIRHHRRCVQWYCSGKTLSLHPFRLGSWISHQTHSQQESHESHNLQWHLK